MATSTGRLISAAAALAVLSIPTVAAPVESGSQDLLPSLSNQGAWFVSNSGGLEVGIRDEDAREPNTFGARVYKVDGMDLHAAIVERNPVPLIDGHQYVLTVLARADSGRTIRVVAESASRDHHCVGLDANLPLGFTYKSYSVSFVARNTLSDPSHVVFAVGDSTGSVWIQQLKLVDIGSSNTATNTL